MIRTYALCIVTLLLILAENLNAQFTVGDQCRTSRRERGTCQNIRECSTFLSIIKRQPISSTDQRYLQDSLCQWDNKTPIVCCPEQTNRPEPTRPTQPPPPITSESDNVRNHPSLRLLPEKTCGLSFVTKIFGGNETLLGEYPWLVLLGYKRSVNAPETFLCGGALINKRYVVTAAHCVTNIQPYTLNSVRLGEHDQSKNPDCDDNKEDEVCAPPPQNLRIERVIPHRQYSSTTKHNDIAILRLERDADTSSEYVRPICLPYDSLITRKSYVNENLTVAGWGKVNANTFSSNVKMYVDVPVRDSNRCRDQYSQANREIIPSQLCAGGVAGKDSCTGDSGGPLMSTDYSSFDGQLRYFLTGIVSYGPKDCGTEGWPAVYTRVGSYAKWILDNMNE